VDQPGILQEKKSSPRVNAWGLSSIGSLVLAGVSIAVCQRLFQENANLCLWPYALFDLVAVPLGIVAAVRGSKWWLLTSLFGLALTAQAFLAMATS
jgi:hypothetical protein